MSNTSATGGYLLPTSDGAIEDDAFEDLVCSVISGISGIVRVNVRPRWQAKPPPFPKDDVTWCAAGFTEIESDFGVSIRHVGEGQGSDEVVRHDTVRVLASFYGPLAWSKASLTRDGLCVSQNRDVLRSVSISLLECRTLRNAADLLNDRWVRKVDLEILLRRAVTRIYPILNLVSVQGEFRTDLGYVQPFVTES